MSKLASEFKQFVLRGNVVDLAVGIVIGVAFSAVVQALVRDFITPLLGVFGKTPNFANRMFHLGHSEFHYGDFINAILAFLLMAVVVFFFVIKPINFLTSLSHHDRPPDPTTRKCPECLSEIPLKANRCAFCTSDLTDLPAQVSARVPDRGDRPPS